VLLELYAPSSYISIGLSPSDPARSREDTTYDEKSRERIEMHDSEDEESEGEYGESDSDLYTDPDPHIDTRPCRDISEYSISSRPPEEPEIERIDEERYTMPEEHYTRESSRSKKWRSCHGLTRCIAHSNDEELEDRKSENMPKSDPYGFCLCHQRDSLVDRIAHSDREEISSISSRWLYMIYLWKILRIVGNDDIEYPWDKSERCDEELRHRKIKVKK
jgi:hypothetical protein